MTIEDFGIGYVKSSIARRAKEKRLSANWSRKTLSERIEIAESTLKRFETTGEISLDNLLRLAMGLGCLGEFEALFPPQQTFQSLAQMNEATRKRGRK